MESWCATFDSGKNQFSLDSHSSISGSMLDSLCLREILGPCSHLRGTENQFSFFSPSFVENI